MMKRKLLIAIAVGVTVAVQFLAGSCESPGFVGDDEGEIRLSFSDVANVGVRAVSEVPDTSDFLLTVKSSSGSIVYDGKYGDCPEAIKVPAGSYTVNVRSSEFVKPAFSMPQYGDDQCVVLKGGDVLNVALTCRQVNSGIRLDVAPGFLSAYPDGILFLKSADGKLMYSYSEKRIAFFNSGPVSLILSRGGKDEVLMTRELESCEILLLKVDVSGAQVPSGGKGISVSVDTTRNWIEERFVIGENSGGGSPDNALSVTKARSLAPMSDVWVSGYIVGGDLTQSSASFEEPFKSRTNILIGPKASTSDRNACIAVQLQAGSLRENLNLVDNPSCLGRRVCLRGDLVEAYFNLVGLKNLSDFEY